MYEVLYKKKIGLVQNEKTSIQPEIFNDICKLSKYFIIPKFNHAFAQIRRKKLSKDPNFLIQIMIDSINNEDNNNDDDETDLINDVENFLRNRINECIGNLLFKKLPVSTIYRILDGVDRDKIIQNQLIDFISESSAADQAKKMFINQQRR